MRVYVFSCGRLRLSFIAFFFFTYSFPDLASIISSSGQPDFRSFVTFFLFSSHHETKTKQSLSNNTTANPEDAHRPSRIKTITGRTWKRKVEFGHNSRRPLPLSNKLLESPCFPTFAEFIEYVVNNSALASAGQKSSAVAVCARRHFEGPSSARYGDISPVLDVASSSYIEINHADILYAISYIAG